MRNDEPRPAGPVPEPERPPMEVVVSRRKRPADAPPPPAEDTTEVDVLPNAPPPRPALTEAQYRRQTYLARQESLRQRIFYIRKVVDLIWFIVGIIEVLLAMRFIFEIAGARPSASFITFLDGVTSPFLWPFSGVFPVPRHGLFVFDPNILVAMLIWFVVGWGLTRLLLLAVEPPWEP